MATQNPNLPAFFNVDQDFRDWVAGIHTMFTNCGLVQTADTGQINTATVTKPSGANNFPGYSIWRFADALQATAPVFIRFDFGSGSGFADEPALKIQVGSNTNGSGTLGGQTGTQKTIDATAQKSAGVTLPSWISGDSGGIRGFINYDGTNSSFGLFFLIERPRNADGTYQDAGVHTLYESGTSARQQEQFVPSTGSVPSASTSGTGFFGAAATVSAHHGNSSSGGNVALWPYIVMSNGKVGFLSLFVFNSADIAADVTSFSATCFGGSHTLLPFKKQTSNPLGSSAYRFAVLWE